MTDRDAAELDALCEAHGIVTSYRDNWDDEHEAPAATKRALLAAMGAASPAQENLPLAMPPASCATLAENGARLFGPAIQLYALRSKRNWGIGDFTDLAAVIAHGARQGAALVGINPLHELFQDQPEAASPYSPSSRLTVNPLYLDVEAIPDFAECEEVRATVRSAPFQARLSALRETELVDHAGVAAAKWPLLGVLFEHFRGAHLASMSVRGRAFQTFVEQDRERVFDAALFAALQAYHRRRDDGAWGWPAWPPAYRDRSSDAVREFAREHADAVDFHLYLQWQADLQLADAAQVAREEGMPVGLYRDLAVGANPGGAETWREPQLFAMSVHVGAPPDDFNRTGQDWGLPPWIPDRLRASGYAPWVALLRANMRHAGALRIDHVMGLLRLFWVPAGTTPADGAYVRYPLSDLLALLALESVRSGCIVIGEDLGTVPDDLRQTLKGAGVYSYRVLYFERDPAGVFLPPDAYPAHALVAISTHDLPTLQGYWQGTDLAARDALGVFPTAESRDQQYGERQESRARLREALAREGLDSPQEVLNAHDVLAIHAYAARTPCALMTFQLEDVFGQALQANLPATMNDQYPNWRRKLALPIEDWERDGRFAAVCAAIRRERAPKR